MFEYIHIHRHLWPSVSLLVAAVHSLYKPKCFYIDWPITVPVDDQVAVIKCTRTGQKQMYSSPGCLNALACTDFFIILSSWKWCIYICMYTQVRCARPPYPVLYRSRVWVDATIGAELPSSTVLECLRGLFGGLSRCYHRGFGGLRER